jgi:hypothetical protein
VLREVCGLQISAGSLLGWAHTCSQVLSEVEIQSKEGLR